MTRVYAVANTAYRARNVDAKTDSDDARRGLAHFARFTVAQFDAINALNVDAGAVESIAQTGNVKTLLRLPALLEFCITGDRSALTGRAKTAVAQMLALAAGARDRDALAFAATGNRAKFHGDNIDVEKFRMFARALGLGTVGNTTEPTQFAVGFAKGNLCAILGAATKETRNGLPVLNQSSGIFRAIAGHVNRISERDLIAMIEETETKQRAKGAKKTAK